MDMDVDGGSAHHPSSSSSAPPVRSCTTCAKAKAKCVRIPGQEICERCARLRKECFSKEPVIRKKKIVKTTRAAQFEKLESKLEHLVNALASGQQGAPHQYGQPSPPTSHTSPELRTASRSTLNASRLSEDDVESPPGSGPPSDVASPAPGAESSFGGIPSTQAEELLDRYRRLMAPGLPFVAISSKATARSMHDTKPVLLRAILTVAHFHDLPKQQLLVKELLQELSERIIMGNEKNIDILQSIVVFLAWYHIHMFWSQQVNNLLHLAMSVSVDMSMNRAPHQTLHDFRKATAQPQVPYLGARVLSLDEHRALVGIFYFSSMLASCFKRIHAMPYTKYMDESVRCLEQAREYESDIFLVQMVRIQRVIEQIHTTDSPNAPVQMFVKAFHTDIEALRKADPCRDDNIFLRMEYLIAEILLWELSLNDLQEKGISKTRPLATYLDDLFHCLEAIKAFIEIYFSLPASAYFLLPFSVFAQFAHVFIVLVKLCVLEVEGWDLKTLSGSSGAVNFSNIIDECNTRFIAASRAGPDGLPINNDTFSKFTLRLSWMKKVYEAKFGRLAGEEPPHFPPMALAGPQPGMMPSPMPPQMYAQLDANGNIPPDFFNYVDENFWNTFVSDFDLGFPGAGAGMPGGMA